MILIKILSQLRLCVPIVQLLRKLRQERMTPAWEGGSRLGVQGQPEQHSDAPSQINDS
jgi:hypothetical protein